jgi:hypothetical protein
MKDNGAPYGFARRDQVGVMVKGGRVICLALAAFCVGRMMYIFPSGNAQPADILFILVATPLLLPAIRLTFLRGNHLIVALLAWVMVVSTTWYMLLYEDNFLKSAAFYGYNVLVFVIFAYAYEMYTEELRRWLRLGIAVAFMIQVVILLGPSVGVRATGTFNNPNQLGYWSILLLGTYGVLMHDRRLNWFDLIVVGLSVFVAIKSVSQATLGVAVLLLLVFLVLHPAKAYVRPCFVALAIAAALILTLEGAVIRYISNLQTVSAIEYRYERALQRDNELEVRGYDRIWRYPQYIVGGAGEGDYDRFQAERELHSSFGTMLFSYGVVGLALFLAVLYQSLRSTPLLVKLYVLPVLLYGLTHQGLRFSWFWMLLGIAAAIGSLRRVETWKRAPQLRSPVAWSPRGHHSEGSSGMTPGT